MDKLSSLIKRNIKVFFANKSNIFFSQLAIIILLILHFAVLREMNAANFMQTGAEFDEKWSYWMADTLMLSAIIPIGAITLAINTLEQIVLDKERKIIDDLYVAPVSRNTLLFSYIISSLIIGTITLLIFIGGYQIYFINVYGVAFTFNQISTIIAVALLSIVFANSFVMIIVSFVKRSQVMGSIGTIMGTLIGFLCGAYIPMGVLGDTTVKILTLLPFAPLTALARQSFLMNISATGLPEIFASGKSAKVYGYELYLAGEKLTIMALTAIVLIYVVIFIIALIIRFKKMKKSS